jgi:hypothetical protein
MSTPKSQIVGVTPNPTPIVGNKLTLLSIIGADVRFMVTPSVAAGAAEAATKRTAKTVKNFIFSAC